MHKKERITNDGVLNMMIFFMCVLKIFLVNAEFQVGNNVPIVLIQRIYE